MTTEIITIAGSRHVVWQCGTCGVFATAPEIVYEQRRAEGGYNFCPNGHQWGWSEEGCEREKLRRERDRLQQRLAEKDDEIARNRNLREETERKLTATRGVITRIKNRVGAGVCPCCTRSFGNLARHMSTKHPEYRAEAAE